MNKFVLTFVMFALFSIGAPVQANHDAPDAAPHPADKPTDTTRPKNTARPILEEYKDGHQDFLEERGAFFDERKDIRANATSTRQEFRDDVKGIRGDGMEAREGMRQEIKDLKESGATPEEIRMKIQEGREVLKLERQERKVEFTDAVKERVGAYAENIIRLLTARIHFLESIVDRIEERSATLADEGVDVSTVEAAVADAVTAIEAAKIAVAEAETAYAAMTGSENPAEYRDAFKAAAGAAHDAVKVASEAIRTSIQALKTASGEPAE